MFGKHDEDEKNDVKGAKQKAHAAEAGKGEDGEKASDDKGNKASSSRLESKKGDKGDETGNDKDGAGIDQSTDRDGNLRDHSGNLTGGKDVEAEAKMPKRKDIGYETGQGKPAGTPAPGQTSVHDEKTPPEKRDHY